MTETTVGRETVQIVELVVPSCALTFGTSPCTATGTADEKCFNTRATCLDPDNFDGSSTVTYRFSRGHIAERGVSGAPYLLPYLRSVSTVPTRLNLSAADRNSSGLGNRAGCTIEFADAPHTDRVFDPYLSGRTYDPLTRGSFWSKWMRRNLFRQNIVINVHEGYAGQALSAMRKRTYFMIGVPQFSGTGRVTIKGKDVLTRIEERKARYPAASPGKLKADISETAQNVAVIGASTSDYSATGTLRINDEILTYDSVSGTDGLITFGITARGAEGTVAAAHSADDKVQECARFTDENCVDVVEALLLAGNVPAGYIDDSGTFADEKARHLAPYNLTTLITEPVPVTQLVAELQEQCGFYIWWDESASLIKMKAVRGVEELPDTITDEAHILAGSFSVTELPESRISQVWVYFMPRNGVADLSEEGLKRSEIVADLASESDDQYGEASVRVIYSRWLRSDGLAFNTGFRLVNNYADTPRRAMFRLDAKDRDYDVADVVYISHPSLVTAHGERDVDQWTIVSREEIVPGEVVEFVAEDTRNYGRVFEYMADAAGDYPGAASVGFTDAYYGDADGLLSDGNRCATYG